LTDVSTAVGHRCKYLLAADREAVGLLYAILAAVLYAIAFFRARHSQHDFSDEDAGECEDSAAMQTAGQQGGRRFGRPFATAGGFVVAVTVAVAAIEIALLYSIFHL
jgi:hypothetical protein